MGKLSYIVLTTVAVGIASTAEAALIRSNDPSISGMTYDGYNITIDSVSTLEWLDVSITNGRSYTDVNDEFGPSGDFPGFRHATTEDMASLFATLGYSNPTNIASMDLIPEFDTVKMVLRYIGDDRFDTVDGWFDDTTSPGQIGRASIRGFLGPGGPFGTFYISAEFGPTTSPDTSLHEYIGNWLVRGTAVPEPTSIVALVGMGIVSLALRTNRRRRNEPRGRS